MQRGRQRPSRLVLEVTVGSRHDADDMVYKVGSCSGESQAETRRWPSCRQAAIEGLPIGTARPESTTRINGCYRTKNYRLTYM